MELVLLKDDFDINKIKIETEKIFQHLKDFLINDSKEFISSKLCSIYAIKIDSFIRGFISLSLLFFYITNSCILL
ncbi:MAG: hypothetical protein PHS49_02040 [Candidatus Gracilibacteria bacterium]|nr:hypothetical protein [Candidatus Gracilibacteria bacterium]